MKGLVLVTMLLVTSCVAGQDTQNCTDCYTKHCVSVGYETIHGLNRSVNPCDNFYQYACGGWLQRQFVTSERKRVWFNDTVEPIKATIKLLKQNFTDGDCDAVKKAKNLFKSCLESVNGYGNTIANSVREIFRTWPFGCEPCNVSDFNLERTLINLTRLGVHPLFTLSAHVNHLDYNATAKNVKRYLQIGAPILYFPVSDYLDLVLPSPFFLRYAEMIISGAGNVVPVNNHNRANDDALEIIDVERLIHLHVFYDQSSTTKSSLDSLNQKYGQLMNWTRYINELASTGNTHLGEIELNETIFVTQPSALISIIDYFMALPKRKQINYLAWRLFDTLQNARIKLEDKKKHMHQYDFEATEYDKAYYSEQCAWFVSRSFPLVVQRMLYAEYVTQATVQKVNSMFQQIKYEFNALLASNNWFPGDGKSFIKEKIDSITTVIANYVEVMDDEFLDSYYSSVAINTTHENIERDLSYYVAMIKEEAFIRNFWSIKHPEKFDFEQLPQVFSAQLITPIHEIVLSFASVFPPWFLDQAPMAVNYAGAMHTIASSLLAAIDPEGIEFHRNGTHGDWISDVNKEIFIERTRCLLDQYSRYPPLLWPDPRSDRFNLIIADNVAVKLTYRAYRNYSTTATEKRHNIGYSGFTNDQLFFIRAAQMLCNKGDDEPIQFFNHSLTKTEVRVNQPLKNSLEFAYVFKCPCGSPMNPRQKCEVW